MNKNQKNGQNGQATQDENPLANTPLDRSGTTFAIPKGASADDAIKVLEKLKRAEEADQCIRQTVPVSPLEGALALSIALQRRYGVILTPDGGSTIAIAVGLNDVRHVPVGHLEIPNREGAYISIDADKRDGRFQLKLHAHTKGKFEAEIRELIAEVAKIAVEESPYKGQAFELRLSDEYGDTNPMPEPKFLNLPTDPIVVIFQQSIEAKIRYNLLTPIQRTADVAALGVPINRKVLLAGGFGVGKTLNTHRLAQVCVENKWTFVSLPNPHDLAEAIPYVEQWGPCVLVVEDIDRIVGEDRDDDVNEILNVIDGISTKNNQVMLCFTSNNPHLINKAMQRPGRIDCAILVETPDAEAAERLIRLYAGAQLDVNAELSEAGTILAGLIPASIAEAVRRSKLVALNRPDFDGKLKAEDITTAAEEVKAEAAVFKGRTEEEKLHAAEMLGRSLGRELAPVLGQIAARNGHVAVETVGK